MRRLSHLATITFALAPAIIVACTSETIVTSSSGFGGSGSIGSIPPEEGPPPKPLPEDRCPSSIPTDDGSCVGQSGTCDYGADLRDTCNVHAYCNGSRWSITTSSCSVNCPKTRAEVVPGTVCGDANMACSWLEGTCGCVAPKADAGAPTDAGADSGTEGGVPLKKGTWVCVPPPSNESICPLSVPKSGTTCVKSTTCDYGSCALQRELTFVCSGHVWSKTLPKEKCSP